MPVLLLPDMAIELIPCMYWAIGEELPEDWNPEEYYVADEDEEEQPGLHAPIDAGEEDDEEEEEEAYQGEGGEFRSVLNVTGASCLGLSP